MTALIIITAIALIITALLLLRIKIVIEYADELIIYAKILFIKIPLIPKEEKSVKISQYTPKKILKRQQKEAEKKRKKAAKKASEKEENLPQKKKQKTLILETIRLIRALLAIFLKRFFGHLRIDIAKLNIRVGGEDAAAAAIMYGYISQSVAYLIELLDRFTNLKHTNNTDISVTPDFVAEKTFADIKLAFSLSVGGALDIIFCTAFGYVKSKMKI